MCQSVSYILWLINFFWQCFGHDLFPTQTLSRSPSHYPFNYITTSLKIKKKEHSITHRTTKLKHKTSKTKIQKKWKSTKHNDNTQFIVCWPTTLRLWAYPGVWLTHVGRSLGQNLFSLCQNLTIANSFWFKWAPVCTSLLSFGLLSCLKSM